MAVHTRVQPNTPGNQDTFGVYKPWDRVKVMITAVRGGPTCSRVPEDLRLRRTWPKSPHILATLCQFWQVLLMDIGIAVEPPIHEGSIHSIRLQSPVDRFDTGHGSKLKTVHLVYLVLPTAIPPKKWMGHTHVDTCAH